jgi:ferritin-like metal-binding protein YciE
MSDDTRDTSLDSLPELYHDMLWNIDASARIMLAKLPGMASIASDADLATLLRDYFGLVSHHHAALESILARFGQPARVHAAELEALVGNATRWLAERPSGEAKDVGLCAVVRTAINMVIPACEIAMNLAATVGYETQIETLASLRQDLLSSDARLVSIVRGLLDAHSQWTETHRAIKSPPLDARL